MNYIAIIGDIKNSKKIAYRGAVQSKLSKVLEQVNREYKEEIAAKFVITLGDEFQGLMTSGEHLLEIIRAIQTSMEPVEIRFGIGVGKITTKVNSNAAIGADGPAYYAARSMIEDLRLQEKKLKKQASDVKVQIYGKGNDYQIQQLNILLRVSKVLRSGWTAEQKKTIMDMEWRGGSQEEIAKRLGISQSTVARRLSSANYLTYYETEEAIKQTMGRL